MASLKTQIEAGASYTDLAALADQLAADYTAVQEAADALSQSQTEAESANSALQLANQTFQKAVEEYNTKVTEANEKIAGSLTDELEKLSDACDEAERNETTAQPALCSSMKRRFWRENMQIPSMKLRWKPCRVLWTKRRIHWMKSEGTTERTLSDRGRRYVRTVTERLHR